MTLRRRLGVLATAVSGLLAAGLLLSAPAFAWHATLSDVHTRCPSNPHPGQTRVSFTIAPSPAGHSGTINVSYSIDGGASQDVPASGLLNQEGKPQSTFGPDDESLDLHFFVPSPTEEGSQITVTVGVTFNDLPANEQQPPEVSKTVDLVVCTATEATTSTTATTATTVITPTTVVASSTTAAGGALGETTTTAGGGSLPFTGSNAMPMLIAALALVLGGGGLLVASRIRGRQAE
jgi:hypothetical protein